MSENDLYPWARSVTFVILEQLPNTNSNLLVRKVAVTTHTDIFKYKVGIAPTGNVKLSLAQHALGTKPSPFLSFSSSPLGSPTNILERVPGQPLEPNKPILVDFNKLKSKGFSLHTTSEIVTDIRRLMSTDRTIVNRANKLIDMIQTIEYEHLYKGDYISPNAIRKVGPIHARHITSAESIMLDFVESHRNLPRAKKELAGLRSSYNKARYTGQAFRVVGAAGIVLSAYDVTRATKKSIEQKSAKPITAETIRQIGGWGAGWAGAKAGCAAGALIGIETGPGAVLTCGAGAILVGAAGYFGADWVADHIDTN
jgi:hypothetical protein